MTMSMANISQDSHLISSQITNTANMNVNVTSSSLSQPIMINIQQTSMIPNTSSITITGSLIMTQIVSSRKHTHSESLIPHKQHHQELLDIINLNLH